MSPEAALQAGLDALWHRVPMVAWFALLLLLAVDRRPVIFSSCIALGLTALVSSLSRWAAAEGNQAAAWLPSLLLAGVAFLQSMRGWLANGRPRSAGLSNNPNTISFRGFLAIAGCGTAAASCAFLMEMSSISDVSSQVRIWLGLHHSATIAATAQLIVCGLQLTFLETPDRLAASGERSVAWLWLARVGLAAFLLEFILAGVLFGNTLDKPNLETATLVLVRGYAISLSVVQFVAWMIPHRLFQFDCSGAVRQWTSLMLSAWLTVLALATVLALPISWPWRDL